jgi:OOP family OmpA-OmpF porin
MRMRKIFLVLGAVSLLAFLGACAGGPATSPHSTFQAQDLNPLIQSGAYVQKVDSFLVILDASGTMYGAYEGHRKIDLAKGVVNRMNMTIPDLKLTAGLRSLGQNFSTGTRLMYGLTDYTKDGLEAAVNPITGGGMTPLATAINAAGGDLKAGQGNMALIVVSDGLETDTSSVASAKSLKDMYGDRLCIYTVVIGEEPRGIQLMEQTAKASGCGFSVNGNSVMSSEGMANFVRDVFLAKGKGPIDSDGDGVYDHLDKCPGTPAGVKVDKDGCPLDTDGDGVPDYLDKCPGTPAGVKVDKDGCPLDTDGDGVPDYLDKCPKTPVGAHVDDRGCWVLEGLYFDTDKWDIKPAGYPILAEVIKVLKKNPNVQVEIQGHTDSRGTDAHNQKLSENRANAVMNYLVKGGVDASRLAAKGLGESRPAVPNTSAANMAKNRRVQLNPVY